MKNRLPFFPAPIGRITLGKGQTMKSLVHDSLTPSSPKTYIWKEVCFTYFEIIATDPFNITKSKYLLLVSTYSSWYLSCISKGNSVVKNDSLLKLKDTMYVSRLITHQWHNPFKYTLRPLPLGISSKSSLFQEWLLKL